MTRPVLRSRPAPVARITALSAADCAYLCIAIAELARARVLFTRRPIRDIIARLGTVQLRPAAVQPGSLSPSDLDRIRWSIAAAAARVPWRSDCLIQVMAADRWLRRKRTEGAFHLGVAKEPDGTLRSHAWLTCGGVVVAGGSGDGFTLLVGPQTRANRSQIVEAV